MLTVPASLFPEQEAAEDGILLPLQSTLRSVCAARGGFGSIAPMGLARKVADSCDKYLVRDSGGHRLAVLSLSPAERPLATEIAASRTREAQAALGSRLGRTVLMPWHTGKLNGVGYSIAPYHRPLSTFRPLRAVERRQLMPRAWRWLQEALRHTVHAPDAQQLRDNFLLPLAVLADLGAVSSEMRQRAKRELRALEAGDWPARLSLAHYDLWDENFLFAPDESGFGFVVIDWGGARAGGHAIYDLVRMAQASPASHDDILAQLREHSRILECAPEHATGHALAALGYLAMNLGDWPVNRFAATAQRTFNLLTALEQRYRERRRVPIKAMQTHDWGMASQASEALQRLDLADYDALMHADVGPPFKTKPGLAIHQLHDPITGQALFLKRCTEPPSDPLWRLAARRWLRQRPLHSEPYHVHLAAQTLQAHGFNPMPVVAWGERRSFGWLPDQGFMVARGVPGDSLDGLFADGTAEIRQRVLHVVGLLMARLHQRGFCVTLRLYDLFVPVRELQAATWRSVEPAIIDLDFKGHVLRETGFALDRAIRTIAHSVYLMLRTGLRFAPGDAAAWLRAYRQQLRGAGVAVPRRLAALLRRQVQIELTQHHKNPKLVAMFPATPQAVASAHAHAYLPLG